MIDTSTDVILKHIQQAAEEIMNEEVEKALAVANTNVRRRMADIVASTTIRIMERVNVEYSGRQLILRVELPEVTK